VARQGPKQKVDLMDARDVMTTEVLSVAPDTPIRDIAQLLLQSGISAVPVVDGTGAPVGMVSEGDLVGRNDADRQARRDWWLMMLAEGEALHPDFLATLGSTQLRAQDVMTAPVMTVGEDVSVAEIARILSEHHIKRVPVLRDGRMVGIVSRADLIRALASESAEPATPEDTGRRPGAFARAGRADLQAGGPGRDGPPAAEAPKPEGEALSAQSFRHLVAGFKDVQARQREEARRAAAAERKQRMQALLDQHISNESWRTLLAHAHQAAERGQTEFLLLRFPSQLCSDGGRSINVGERGWPKSLRGEAAEIYLWWEQDLKPQGFHLAARVLDFPGGMPGDVGLFLAWGE
jgi:CBS domain-containing protein